MTYDSTEKLFIELLEFSDLAANEISRRRVFRIGAFIPQSQREGVFVANPFEKLP